MASSSEEFLMRILLARPDEVERICDEENKDTYKRTKWNRYYISSYHTELLSALKGKVRYTQKNIEEGIRGCLVKRGSDCYSYHPKDVLPNLQRAVEYFSNPPIVEETDV